MNGVAPREIGGQTWAAVIKQPFNPGVREREWEREGRGTGAVRERCINQYVSAADLQRGPGSCIEDSL